MFIISIYIRLICFIVFKRCSLDMYQNNVKPTQNNEKLSYLCQFFQKCLILQSKLFFLAKKLVLQRFIVLQYLLNFLCFLRLRNSFLCTGQFFFIHIDFGLSFTKSYTNEKKRMGDKNKKRKS